VIRMQFVLGSGLSSRAIAWFSSGHFSHVDAILPNGRLLGARSDQIGHVPPGVEIRAPFYEKWKERVVMTLVTDRAKERAFYDFLHAQLGKPYDKTAIWGFVTGRDWRDDKAWFCSELQTAALEIAGIFPTLYAPRNKITPATLATLMSDHQAATTAYASPAI
jgi:uncharacterized protein YycO